MIRASVSKRIGAILPSFNSTKFRGLAVEDLILNFIPDEIFADRIPKCTKCKSGIVKPDIVFFGENLPDKFYKCTETDFAKCDLLIIMGSSLVVQPFASLIDR